MNSKNKYRAWDKIHRKMISHNHLFALDCSNEYPFLPLLQNMYREELDVIIMQYTGYNDKNNREVYEEDFIPYHFDESKIGIIKYGGYKNICDDQHALHIGFYVDWQDEHLKLTCRKDLGYWLKVSVVAGNTFEGLYNKNNKN